MDSGTGAGAASVIARIAREMGILTVGLVTRPFERKGGRPVTNAETELQANVDSLIVLHNDKLQNLPGDNFTRDAVFTRAYDVMKIAVSGFADIINVQGHVAVDFEDVRTVMGQPGKAMMGFALASGPDRARIAAEQSLTHPLFEGLDLSGAQGVLVMVAAGSSFRLGESKLAMSTIRAHASPHAHIIYGTIYDEALGDEIRVTVVAAGIPGTDSNPSASA
jgi:cell division protein FtsZ